ncbi:MAG: tetratricopeptide repeat protein, partial [Nitrospirae bacterium]|nr:tetratricopeptide repeat protein [Nitrospirota bacterium]
KIHGFAVAGYHVVNLAIHMAASILVYILVLLTFETPFMTESILKQHTRSIALFSSLLFAVHPLQTEAVTYVFQRFASLVAFFCLLSLTAYIQSRLSKDKWGRLFFYSVSFISAVLAMKTKENAFTLPLVIMLYEFCFFSVPVGQPSYLHTLPPSQPHQRFRYLAPMFLTIVIIPLTLIRLGVTQHTQRVSYLVDSVFSRWEYFINQFRVIVTYLRLLFFPVNQNLDYDYRVFKTFFEPQVMLSFLFLAAIFGLGVYLTIGKIQIGKEKWVTFPLPINYLPNLRLMGFGILWFFITLSVESSIIPLPNLICEYRVYLPSVGVIISVVAGAFMLKNMLSPKLGNVVLLMLVLAIGTLSVATYMRNGLWGDALKLWEDTARKSPAKAKPHFILANQYSSHSMPDKAVEQYQIAIRLQPNYPEAHSNLGTLYEALNMPDKAVEQYQIAIRLDTNCTWAHYNLGVLYKNLNMNEEAVKELQTSIRLMPEVAESHFILGVVYYRMGQVENAQREIKAGLKIAPDNQQALELLKKISH